jgi:NodT family efflux transporter outer membrane factor (OMF) lipoprotein
MPQPGAPTGASEQPCNRGAEPPGAHKTWLASALAGLLLAGCAVGPDFNSPEVPAAAQGPSAPYTPTPVPEATASVDVAAGAAQHLRSGQDIQAQWWALFHSDALNQLISAALARNPNLAAAQASLRQAQESLGSEKGALLYPNVGLQAGIERQRTPLVTAGLGQVVVDYTTYSVGLGVSYQLDLFGGNRRTLEGLAAAVDYQRFQVEGVYLTLVSNVVVTAIREASLRAQVQATQEVLALQEQQLKVVNVQFNAGAVPKSAVLTQQTQVAQTRATLPPLQKSLAQTRHQLSVYAGRLPSELGIPEFQLDSLRLPPELPVSLPSALVRQRPDIRANEALLHEASAQVGVATAALYPQLNLNGTYGSGANRGADLFTAESMVWSAIAGLTQPIFNGGSLSAKKRAAIAAYDASQAQYQATLLGAFQNVADALRAIEYDATALQTQADAASLARQSLDLSESQYTLGAVSYLQLLDAQRTYQQTRISLVQAQAARFSDTAALFQALGGSWWNEGPLADVSRPGSDATTDRPGLATVPPAQPVQ